MTYRHIPARETATSTARRFFAAALALFVWLGACPVRADGNDDAMTRANHMAYQSAIKCFIVNGILAGDKREDGNSAQQAAYEVKARESFEIATKAGNALGFTGTRINEDFGLAQSNETPRLVNDGAYFKRTATMCKSLGLM